MGRRPFIPQRRAMQHLTHSSHKARSSARSLPELNSADSIARKHKGEKAFMASEALQKVAPTSPPPPPFAAAAQRLADICARLDSGEAITPEFLQLFRDGKAELTNDVERTKNLMAMLKAFLTISKRAKKYWTERNAGLTKAIAILKESTKQTIEARPDLPYKDSFGKPLQVVETGTATLRFKFDPPAKKVVSNIVDMQAVEFFSIPAEYLEHVSFIRLNTDKLRADLDAGKKLDWAYLERSTHVRGW
jgi:hypothetical protein